MKLRSLLHRKTTAVPLLPSDGPGDGTHSPSRTDRSRRKGTGADEERLERLLTPSELDLVEHHRI
ncbi:hypothetical protein [Nocardia huaxiensis]|uniref:Uncharacterized protein n=1 Tax=Nocardia huaxiensis TaxID=2755382 RepID=A0A7D6VC18_9NOCA|nr:hypothetical protein [Nocardia huaxiensis]QLY30682.1 hypothetical protein H0264_37230 [Nocardia huaxiensis]UFS94173.1 hypothetical protein LPY97_25825 [Nocardia huaxiensis]